MTIEEVKGLHPGNVVHWTDPDQGLCSRQIQIADIEIAGEDLPEGPSDDAIISITGADGSELECYAHELS